jgi:hypothetical protein
MVEQRRSPRGSAALIAALWFAGCSGGGGDGTQPPPQNRAPTATISSPAQATVSVAVGGSVTFAGSCSDPDNNVPFTHAWSFGGGAPSSTSASPGAVTFATAGTFTVTYVCTDALGLASATASRTVNVGDQAQSGWTVLVYVAADNDLEPFALGDLQEMTAGASAGVNIIAQVDRSAGYASDGVSNLPNWTSSKRLEVNPGSITELADLGETDTTDPATLASFIAWGVAAYPASRYMLILWDHGGGWTGFGVDELLEAGGAPAHGLMRLPAITSGIASGLAAAGLSKLDIVGFDACLMATLEVAHAMSPHAHYLLASEETEPGHGWDYAALNGVTSLGAAALGARIADGYKAQADSPAWDTGAGITLSLVELSRIPAVEAAVADLRTAFGTVPAMTPVAGALGRERARAVSFGKNPNPAADTHLVDIGDLFGGLDELGASAAALRSAVGAAVVYQVRGSTYSQASGLSIYFPAGSAYYDAGQYDPIAGMDDWRAFLGAYYGVTAAPAFDLANSGIALDATTFAIVGALTPGSLAAASNAKFVYGVPGLSGDAWMFGDAPPDVITDAGIDYLVGYWDYTFLLLTQTVPATHAEYGYLSWTFDATQAVASIPLAYYAPGAAQAAMAIRLVAFDLSSSTLLSDVYYVVTADGQVGQLTPVAGSTLRALVAYLPASTQWNSQWIEYTTVGGFDATRPIALGLVPLNTGGPFFAGLRVENAAGSGDWIATDVSSPPTRP